MLSSFLSSSVLFLTLIYFYLLQLKALQLNGHELRSLQDPPTDRCTSDGSCYFGGTCPDPTNGNCICPQYFTGSLCGQSCDQSCGTCIGPNRNQCSSCNTESYYKLNVTDLNECHVICPEGFFEATNNECKACNSNCIECVSDNAAECFTCPSTKRLYNYECVDSCPQGTTDQNGSCASNCPSGQFTNTSGTSDCQACNSVCSSCTGIGVNDCITCANNNYMILDAANNNNTCVATCPSGMWADTTNLICRNCPPNCATCNSNGRICTSCESGFNEVFGTCVSQCPATYYTQAGSNVCYQCHFTCGNCTSFSASSCTSCIQASQVPNWPYTIQFNNQCLNACPSSHVLVNNECIQNCPDNEYAFGGVCNSCPTDLSGVTDNEQVTAILAKCAVNLTSSDDQAKVENANADVYIGISDTIITTDAITTSQTLANATANRNVLQPGEVPSTTSETNIIVYFKKSLTSIADQNVQVDNIGKINIGAKISIRLPSQILNEGNDRCISANIFRNNLYTTGTTFGGFSPPAVDVRVYSNCQPQATRQPISSLSTPATITFTLNGGLPTTAFRCFSWNVSTKAWESTGITTTTNSNSKTASCSTTHFTSFTLREAPDGVTFLLSGDYITQLFPILVALTFVFIGVVAVIFDCYGRKGQNDKFPHQTYLVSYRKCLTVYRYSLLYNLPFLGVFGYFHLVVWCLYKTIWLSFLVWLMVIIQVSVFKGDVGSSSVSTMVVTALLCGILLIPNSFTHWILIKKQRVKARYDPQASERTLKNIMPDASQPIEVDIMSDREIKLFDRKNPGKPALPQVQEEKPTRRGFTQIQEQEILSSIGLFLIIIFSAVSWGLGFGLSLVFGSDINTRNGDHYVRFIGCFLLSILFGIIYSIIKLALSSYCVSSCKKSRNPSASRCRMCFFVDFLTLRIFEDFDTNNIKGIKKRNNRVGIVRQPSGGRKSDQALKTSSNLIKPPTQPKPMPKSSVKVDISARV